MSNCYGMWWKKFALYAKTSYGVEFTDQEAERIRADFFKLYPGLEKWHKNMRQFVRQHGFVRAMHGALRRLPSINSLDEKIQQQAERLAINSPIQRISSDMGLIAMSRFADGCEWDDMRPLLFIHDDVTLEVREDRVEEAASYLKWCMENPPLHWFNLELPLPIASDVSIGPNLGEMEERPDIVAVKPPWIKE